MRWRARARKRLPATRRLPSGQNIKLILLVFLQQVAFKSRVHLYPATDLELGKLLGTLLRGRDPQSLLFVVVEVACVPGSLALGDERSLDLRNNSFCFMAELLC